MVPFSIIVLFFQKTLLQLTAASHPRPINAPPPIRSQPVCAFICFPFKLIQRSSTTRHCSAQTDGNWVGGVLEGGIIIPELTKIRLMGVKNVATTFNFPLPHSRMKLVTNCCCCWEERKNEIMCCKISIFMNLSSQHAHTLFLTVEKGKK